MSEEEATKSHKQEQEQEQETEEEMIDTSQKKKKRKTWAQQQEDKYEIDLERLARKNGHERDSLILFDEPTHKYTILSDLESSYTSVTTWIGSLFEKFDADKVVDNMMKGRNWNEKNKYWGKTREEILQQWKDLNVMACQEGTAMHAGIETLMNYAGTTHEELVKMYGEMAELSGDLGNGGADFSFSSFIYDTASRPEWQYVLNFMTDTPTLRPYRTEWRVFHEEMKLSGSIDMIYENEDGETLDIYDWKRCKEFVKVPNPNPRFAKYSSVLPDIPDTNYWHYVLQLNTYRYILESPYYNKRIRALYLVRFHPEATNYELVQLPLLDKRTIEKAFSDSSSL